jgi:hypothetical protein
MFDVSFPNPSHGGLLKIESALAFSEALLTDYYFAVPSSLLKLIEAAMLLTY